MPVYEEYSPVFKDGKKVKALKKHKATCEKNRLKRRAKKKSKY